MCSNGFELKAGEGPRYWFPVLAFVITVVFSEGVKGICEWLLAKPHSLAHSISASCHFTEKPKRVNFAVLKTFLSWETATIIKHSLYTKTLSIHVK